MAELLYFRLAERFNIIDKLNERSSHSKDRAERRRDNIHGRGAVLVCVLWIPERSGISIFKSPVHNRLGVGCGDEFRG